MLDDIIVIGRNIGEIWTAGTIILFVLESSLSGFDLKLLDR
jgi:hypothetical protein